MCLTATTCDLFHKRLTYVYLLYLTAIPGPRVIQHQPQVRHQTVQEAEG